MKNTLPQSSFWIYLAAILLPFNGGYINGATLMSFLHNSVGYVTGNLVFAGSALSLNEYTLFLHFILLFFCFLFGATISGLIIRSEFYNKDYRYGANLSLQLILTLIALLLLLHHHNEGGYFLAVTMGLQNAMTTHYGTALIRTTHMTGTTTDLGILIAHYLQGKAIQFWKLNLYIILIVCFFLGALLGGYFYSQFQAYGLFVSIAIYIIMLLAYKL